MYSYSIIAALLILSISFTTVFADDTPVNPDNLSFEEISLPYVPKYVPSIIDPQTGEKVVLDNSKNYIAYSANLESKIVSEEKQLVLVDGQEFYLVPDSLDRTANIIAVLLLGIPFGILVYRMSDNDPIPLKYTKISGVAVAFAMLSMFTTPISIGNSFWGYASASSENFPQPLDSIYFDSLRDNLTIDGASIISDDANSAVSFDGVDDYLVLDSNLPEKLNQFTVSTWVKPNYKKGASATLSVISEVDAFDLSINNDKVGKNVATFSVFDGIKWHQVQSKSIISNQWTHISATYSNNEIKIFVNGIREGSANIDSDYSLTHQSDTSTQYSFDHIKSKSDILIGAFNPAIRNNASIQNHFSGLIDDVTLYDKVLASDQISILDSNNRVPDKVSETQTQSSYTEIQQTGTENEYGFVTGDDANDQKIEEVAAEGYKVKKPEETKKKKVEETKASEKAKEVLEENPPTADQNAVETINESQEADTFSDDVVISTSSNSTSIPQTITPPQRTAPRGCGLDRGRSPTVTADNAASLRR